MKFSIITVSHNSERYIRQTIESVLSQTYPDIEYIIIDGCSTDNTCNIIEEYRSRLAMFVSEPDKNMYDAINKGMRLATGDYVSILNSDDFFVNEHVISEIARQINRYSKYDGVYGNLIKVDVDGKIIRPRKGFQVNYKELLLSRKLSLVGHATFFMSKKALNTVGYYDFRQFSYACDYDYILRCFKCFRYKHVNTYVMCFRTHKKSITSSGKLAVDIPGILNKHNYYEYNYLTRKTGYYYLWVKFIFLNAKHLLNKFKG